jgi:pyruvate carboxylase
VRADLGYPPLVTPTSQIVGIQAVINVLTGGRYRQVTGEVRDYVRGLYGTPPGPIDPHLRKKVTENAPAIAGRPADLLPPEFEKMLEEVRSLVPAADTAEALSYALFPAVYKSYRRAVDHGLDGDVLTTAALGVVGALRAPKSAPLARAGAVAEPSAAVSAWAYEGRARAHSQRRWVGAGRPRTRG